MHVHVNICMQYKTTLYKSEERERDDDDDDDDDDDSRSK